MEIMTRSFETFFEFSILAQFCYLSELREIYFITFTTFYDMTYWRNHFFFHNNYRKLFLKYILLLALEMSLIGTYINACSGNLL